MDIAEKGLYIGRLIQVIRSGIPNHHRLLRVDGRHSDAVVYILSGRCTYRVEGGDTFDAAEGDILYLARGAVYTMYIHTEDYRYIYCDFEFLEEAQRRSRIYRPENPAGTEALFAGLLRRFAEGEGSFAAGMSLLYDIYGVIRAAAQTDTAAAGEEDRIRKGRELLDAGYGDADLSVERLAEGLGMSPVYFRRQFRKRYGVTPSGYLASVRMGKAREYLKYPFLSLSDCAELCGYASSAYFCRVFKKAAGMTPTEYRDEA